MKWRRLVERGTLSHGWRSSRRLQTLVTFSTTAIRRSFLAADTRARSLHSKAGHTPRLRRPESTSTPLALILSKQNGKGASTKDTIHSLVLQSSYCCGLLTRSEVVVTKLSCFVWTPGENARSASKGHPERSPYLHVQNTRLNYYSRLVVGSKNACTPKVEFAVLANSRCVMVTRDLANVTQLGNQGWLASPLGGLLAQTKLPKLVVAKRNHAARRQKHLRVN